jgi:hypothetical protein
MIFKKTWQNAILVVTATLLFSLAYYQAPLFSSNQYQYFLHGLAKAGTGTLAEEWLANTVDPTPVFSFLVYFTEKIHARGLFYVYFFILAGIYLFSLISIVNHYFPVKRSLQTFLIFFAGMVLIHSAGLRWLLLQVPGADWGYLFDGGAAGQRLLGQVLQPSVFGVFLLFSISLYLGKKTIPAGFAAVFACIMHPTYLLSSAVLILTYMIDLWFFLSQRIKAVLLGTLALLVVSPIAAYSLINFSGGSVEMAERAREILVNIRIPHHAKLAEWFDAATVIKLILIGTSIHLTRSKTYRLLILLPLGISLILTVIQFITGSSTLALVFPWRISTWLVPISSAVLVGKLTIILSPISLRAIRYSKVITVVVITTAVFSGIIQAWMNWNELEQSTSRSLESYVADNRKTGEIYLIPVKMYEFRVKAGVPVYGDFFSIPYGASEVIEWYSQFLNAKHFYESGDCSLLIDLEWQGVTHVIIPRDFITTCPGLLRQVYEDDAYQLLTFY